MLLAGREHRDRSDAYPDHCAELSPSAPSSAARPLDRDRVPSGGGQRQLQRPRFDHGRGGSHAASQRRQHVVTGSRVGRGRIRRGRTARSRPSDDRNRAADGEVVLSTHPQTRARARSAISSWPCWPLAEVDCSAQSGTALPWAVGMGHHGGDDSTALRDTMEYPRESLGECPI